MKTAILLFVALALIALPKQSEAQLLKKLKDKVNKTINPTSTTGTTSDQAGTNTTVDANGKPVNKGGGGLKNTPPPDVNEQIADAEQSHGAAKYSDARYSLQQALVGIEIQLGREMLKTLPSPVAGLEKDTTQDKVVSAQWGWSNLTIQRGYTDNKDKQLTVTISNNGMYSGFVTMYFNNAYGVQANADNQNMKQVKVKGNKAIIQYDDSKGYTLIVPIGQASMIVWEAINFTDETEVMNAANTFDIDGIKKQMGEQ
ncbi:MAG TPA: hypothetical protein PLA68_11590 [Panacibacter sp.]|nr:hypothetical protein [Panacibacter sp.]